MQHVTLSRRIHATVAAIGFILPAAYSACVRHHRILARSEIFE
jgi:hypothetical protein